MQRVMLTEETKKEFLAGLKSDAVLDLSNTSLEYRVPQLLEFLATYPQIVSLSVRNCSFARGEIGLLAKAQNLFRIDLRENSFDDFSATLFLMNKTLLHLDFDVDKNSFSPAKRLSPDIIKALEAHLAQNKCIPWMKRALLIGGERAAGSLGNAMVDLAPVILHEFCGIAEKRAQLDEPKKHALAISHTQTSLRQHNRLQREVSLGLRFFKSKRLSADRQIAATQLEEISWLRNVAKRKSVM